MFISWFLLTKSQTNLLLTKRKVMRWKEEKNNSSQCQPNPSTHKFTWQFTRLRSLSINVEKKIFFVWYTGCFENEIKTEL